MNTFQLPIELPVKEIEGFCRRWEITELSLFGSVLRRDFRPDSDVDLLVTFTPEARWSLFDLVRMEEELQVIVGRKVDLVERKAVERSENYIRRKSILSHLQPLYVA
jgi:predicted nucleotidyltransferase